MLALVVAGAAVASCTPPPAAGGNVVSVVTTNHSACVLTTSGAVRCWGYNTEGTLGNGTTVHSAVPVTVVGLDSGVRKIAAGTGRVCAITTADALRCWGTNGGALGNGTTLFSSVPVEPNGLGSGVIDVAVGSFHTCALLATGAVKCFGYGQSGALGNGSTVGPSLVPVDVLNLGGIAESIAAGDHHTCAVLTTGAVRCWGANDQGQLGTGNFVSGSLPVSVTGLAGNVASLASMTQTTCAILDGGSLNCWGRNDKGGLGIGTTADSAVPVTVAAMPTPVGSAAIGNLHTCAVAASGTAYCWGEGQHGQLGNGTTADTTTPNPVTGISSAVQICNGSQHTCALKSDRTVACWGNNSYGQLGDGTTTNSNVPVTIQGL